jgi:hypothetical protein
MTIRISGLVSSLLALAMLPMALQAAPSEYNGHYYEVVVYPVGTPISGKEWDDAKAAAEAAMFEHAPGMFTPGHLATITTAGEDAFIETLRATALPDGAQTEAWVGGFTLSDCSPVPGCGWTWINGEGAISTPQVPLPTFANWLLNEPNNLGGGEQHMGIGLGGSTNVGWNDEGNLGNIGGYVVEYDVPTSLPPGSAGTPVPLGPGVDVTLPTTVVLADGAQIDTQTFEYTDDLGACGTSPREIFLPGNSGPTANAVIPAYLCGSPKFLVIVAETTGVTIPDGTILVENEVADVFPDNLYDCTGPNFPVLDDLLLDPNDPQNRDVMAWQSTDRTQMPEDNLGGTYSFPGSVGEFTFECGSSRGKAKSASLYFVGLHIDFGPGFEYPANAAGNHMKFVELTRYKLVVLQDVILESKVALNSNFWQKLGWKALKGLINTAIKQHDRGRYNAALLALRLIDLTVQNLAYTAIPGENYQGETDMRNSNGIFMYTDKVIPYTP